MLQPRKLILHSLMLDPKLRQRPVEFFGLRPHPSHFADEFSHHADQIGMRQAFQRIRRRHLLATRIKVISDVDKEAVARFHEGEVAGLEGVEINADQETWLSILRIRESKPPQADIMFEGWVDFESHPTPDVIPTLRSERVVRMSIEDISEHFEAGIIINPDDIITLDETAGDEFDVILRTAKDLRRSVRKQDRLLECSDRCSLPTIGRRAKSKEALRSWRATAGSAPPRRR
jgi:hypothetical protein